MDYDEELFINEDINDEFIDDVDDEIIEDDEQDEKQNKETTNENPGALRIKAYLEDLCSKDEYFAKVCKIEEYNDCWSYIYDEAKEYLNSKSSFIEDEIVFKWARDYFNDGIGEKRKAEKAEKEKKEKEKKEKIEKQRKQEEERKAKEKAREEEWQKFLAKDSSCTLTENEKIQEQFKHLKQQNLFDF